MPGMDGLEAIQKIRQTPEIAHIPILAVTALAQTHEHQRCLDAGADGFLVKPLKLKQLVNTIRELLTASGTSG